MIDRALVPMDDSEMAEQALRYALESYPEAEVTVLHVVGEPSPMMGQATELALADDIETKAREIAKPVTDRAAEIAAEYDTDIGTVIEVGHPSRAIVNRAEDYDVVVLGAHGGSLADRLLTGNVAERVFRRSPVPVMIVR
ncbi:MAG: universal stress protein [Halodesulfurarchaeum sp.]|nr:universal stress protein [Halodesulfurarchaeum sp.]